MFSFDKDDEGITIRVTGESAQALREIADTLELNVQWPIFPLALDNLYRMCKIHQASDERLRDIVILDSTEKEGIFLFDIEALKVEAKKLEIKGLSGGDEDD